MSTEPPLTDDEISAVAEQLKEHSGVYTRRDIIAAAAATGSLGVLGALGIDTAEATHGTGRAGEPGDPLEAVYANKIGDASEPIHSAHAEDAATDNSFNDILTPKTASDLAAAVDTINADGGGYILQLPRAPKSGTKIDVTGLLLPLDIDVDDVWVRGHGEESTVLDGHGAGTAVFRANNANYQNLVFSDFRAEGDTDADNVIRLVDWHGVMEKVTVQGAGSGVSTKAGIRIEGGNASHITDCSVIGSKYGIYHRDSTNNNPNRATVSHSEFTNNVVGMVWEDTGAKTSQPYTILSFGNLMELNDNQGLFVKGIANPVIFNDRCSRNNQTSGTSEDIRLRSGNQNGAGGYIGGGTECDANGANSNTTIGIDVNYWDSFDGLGLTIEGCIFRDQTNQAIFDRGLASDVVVGINHFDGVSGRIAGNGTRTRWRGMIGGGPLGGVDLSTVSGQFEADEAMSSGATANTGDTAYSSWRWDSANLVWVDESGNTV